MATGEGQWADMIEKAVMNAGMGAITKDFRSLQYFSSVNQVIATGTSNNNHFKHGSTWMAYRPTHETECCSGNIHRLLPNYVSRMWLKSDDGEVVAALYGPSTFSGTSAEGHSYTITEEDAIINKRSNNTDAAVDKMENACQNIILQAMEKLSGILIATTNLTNN